MGIAAWGVRGAFGMHRVLREDRTYFSSFFISLSHTRIHLRLCPGSASPMTYRGGYKSTFHKPVESFVFLCSCFLPTVRLSSCFYVLLHTSVLQSAPSHIHPSINSSQFRQSIFHLSYLSIRFVCPSDLTPSILRVQDGVAVQHFTVVLTDLEGCQRFGFCRLNSTNKTCLCMLR